NQLVQIDIATGLETGVNFDMTTIITVVTGIAGGLCISDAFVPGTWTICGTSQNEVIWGVELGPAAPAESPAAPTDFAVIPDAGGALEATIAWTCPTLQVNGDPLTDLDEMRVYRGEDLIYTDTTPVIGGPAMYVDMAVPAPGTHTYKAVGYNDFGEGIPASGTTWVGEDVPDAVTDLTLTDVSAATLAAQLDWTNPTTGLHGGYFPGVLGYEIERSDGAIFNVTGSLTQWIDDTVPSPGIYWYAVTPFNGSGSGPSTLSPSVGIGISVIEIGNAESTDYQIPINLFYMDSMVECVYDKDWVGMGMIINAIAYHANITTATIPTYNLEVWMGELDIDDLSAGWIDGSQMTQVFDGTMDSPAGDYWAEINLDTPFIYEQDENLVIMIIRDDVQYYSTTDTWYVTESSTQFRTRYDQSDNSGAQHFNAMTGPWTGTLQKTTYPDIRLYYSGIADPLAPAEPTNVTFIPDAGGALECDISWTCPSLNYGGNPLTELLEMRVYRDAVLVYTDTNPIIGGPGNYTDFPPTAGFHEYEVLGYNSYGEGPGVSGEPWVGEDIPDTVTDLTLTDVSTDDLAAQLDWVNPTGGFHGGYFAGCTGYDIERSDGAPFTIAGPVTQWIDDTIIDPGVYWYDLTPFNNSGPGPTSTTPMVGIGVSLVQVGTAEVTDYQIPMNLYWENTIVEMVYDKEWLGSDMLINTVSFHAANIGSAINAFNFEIWLAEIDIDDLSGGWIDATQLTMVFDGTIDVPTGDYWLDIPLDTAFEYEYADNLVMGIIKDDDEYYSTSDTWWTTESGTANRTLHQYSDSEEYSIQSPPAASTAKTTYPDVRFWYSTLLHGDVEGVVTDAVTTNPIEGVEVYVGTWGPATTNAAGEYLLEDLVTGMQDVSAFKEGYYDFSGQVEVLVNQVVTYDFTMEPFQFATLAGNVTDLDSGLPIEDAEIYLLSELGYEFWATTNASGDYSIVDVIADTYDITCTATMYIPQTVQDIVFDGGANIIQDFAMEISIYYFSDFEDND
ncbi:MAG: carboxypeptidase-like regulatory domain-containing protein, partial [Candidatus Stygibacter australis]|nr:carboxypeptidase-like regulatory domain-containing protein [Candidatus Stygibacter australis]